MEYSLFFSLITLGFIGGFSHCTSMCGPFVLTQVGNRLHQTPIDDFSNFTRLKHFALLPYHLGRITTYSLIGFFSSFLTQNISNLIGFKFVAVFLLSGAIIFFVNIFFDYKLSIFLSSRRPEFIKGLKHNKKTSKTSGFFKEVMAFLFRNPQGLKGYALGLILGFIPCGLLYGAFLLAAANPSPLLAAFGMLLFGIATFPALFLTGFGGYIFLKSKIINFRQLIKITALINIAMLLMMIYKIIINV